MNAKKSFLIKFNLGLIILLFGMLLSCTVVKAANMDAFYYMTEIHIEDAVWTWGKPSIHVDVAKEEAVNMQCKLNFVGDEWDAVYQSGLISLDWGLPKGASVSLESDQISAVINDSLTPVGNVEITDSKIIISIAQDYQQFMETSNSVDFSIKVTLKFLEGEHKLSDKVIVNATDTGGSKASWTFDSVLVNNIDEQDESKLLGNAYFEIQEYKYSDDKGYELSGLFNLLQQSVEANDTFIFEDNGSGFITKEDTTALIKGGFKPGNLYLLKEVIPPIGYFPVEGEIKFAYYHYDGPVQSGTSAKYETLNAPYVQRYADVGGVAVFGIAEGYGELEAPNVYIKNRKIPQLQIMKLDADTNDSMEGVEFTLQIQASQTGYSVEEYLNLGDKKWSYDTATGLLKWTEKTNKDGIISYPEGMVPYCSNMYELVETVPEGYEGYGGTKVTRFKVDTNEDGALVIESDTGIVDTVDGVNTIKILNQPVGDVQILKVDEAGKPLKGAEFAIYGTSERNTDDIIEKAGKKYYKLQEATTQKDGTATFTGLPYGDYYLVEKKAPQGYKILKDSHRIEVSKKILEDGVYTVKITNKKQGTPIIDTGGKGIFRNILVGVVLFIVGSFLFLLALRIEKKRRKAKRRAQAARRRANGQAPQRRRKPQRKNRR